MDKSFFVTNVKLGKALLLTVLYILFADFLWRLSFRIPIDLLPINLDVGMVVYGVALVAGMWYFLRKVVNVTEKLPEETPSKFYLLAVLVGSVFVFIEAALNIPVNLVFGTDYGFSLEAPDIIYLADSWTLSMILLVPLAAELYFRKYLLGQLQQHYSIRQAILISAALFALIHLPYYELLTKPFANPPYTAFMAFFSGLVAGFLAYRSRSIGPAVVFQWVWHSVATII